MAESHPPPHAIIFPYPYIGHITPSINLAISLASKGLTVTFVQTEFIHHTHGDIFAESGLDIRFAAIHDGFPLDYDRDANLSEYWEHMMLHFPALVDEMVGNLIRESESDGVPFFLIADSLYTWPHTVAKKHNLAFVSLWTEPATVFSICYHLDLLRQNGHFPCAPDNGVDHINYIPGVQLISTTDMMSFIQHPDVVPVVIKIVIKAFEQLKNADFILCNTVEELEPECLLALDQKQPTYAIGPMNYFFTQTRIVQTSQWPETDCTNWLNPKPPGSVLYISFGSIIHIDKHEIMEIAHGLLLSQVNFIWVLRINSNSDTSDDVFPIGFEAALRDRGLVVPWCNQNAVLSNPAVGGFLTHCGWNSIVESIWSGVPMLCYPFVVDQPTNRKLVVNDWKIGINLRDENCQLTKDETAKKIEILMRGEMCIELRQEVKKFSKILRNALDADGSSQRNYDQFLHDLKGQIYATREDGSHN